MPGPTGALFTKPADALGPPNYPGGNDAPGSVSLGVGGSIVVEFTNNLLTGSNDIAKDPHIFEVGTDVEDSNFVSPIAGTGGKMRFPVKAEVPKKFFRLE